VQPDAGGLDHRLDGALLEHVVLAFVFAGKVFDYNSATSFRVAVTPAATRKKPHSRPAEAGRPGAAPA
jgi:hypothetical protein